MVEAVLSGTAARATTTGPTRLDSPIRIAWLTGALLAAYLFVIPAETALALPNCRTFHSGPIASFTFSPSNPRTLDPVSFDGSGSSGYETISTGTTCDSDTTAPISNYHWSFGDGATQDTSGATTSHSYARAGNYTVSLTVSSQGRLNTTAQTVSASDRPPTARFTPPANVASGQSVTFAGGLSSDPDGAIASYVWSFGDGGTSTGKTAPHTYSTAGTYKVTLTVTDDSGNKDSTTQSVTVAVGPPGSAFGGSSSRLTEAAPGVNLVHAAPVSASPVMIGNASNPPAASVQITLRVTRSKLRRASVAAASSPGAVVGHANVSIAAGQTVALRTLLVPAARAVVRRKGRLRVKATVVARLSTGSVVTTTRFITFRRAPRRSGCRTRCRTGGNLGRLAAPNL